MRGVDFGSWANKSDPIPLVQVHKPDDAKTLSPHDRLLLLPVFGEADEPTLATFRTMLAEEARKCFPCQIHDVPASGRLAEYVAGENLRTATAQLNLGEISRLGRLLDVSHVMIADLRNVRLFPPQNLALHVAVVNVTTGQPIIEMDAAFSATEQQTVSALGEYLDRRQARQYDRTNLDLILRSPTEYGRFVLAECCRVLAENLWTQGKVGSTHRPVGRKRP